MNADEKKAKAKSAYERFVRVEALMGKTGHPSWEDLPATKQLHWMEAVVYADEKTPELVARIRATNPSNLN